MNNTDIFKFMYVKPAKIKSGNDIKTKTIKYTIKKTQLFKEFEELKNNQDFEKLISKSKEAIERRIVYVNVKDIQNELIEEETFLEWITSNVDNIDLTSLKTKIVESKIDLNVTSKLWDSLIVHSVLENPNGILDLLVGLIKLENVLSNFDKGQLLNNLDIANRFKAQVVLPTEIFPLVIDKVVNTTNEKIEKNIKKKDHQKEIITQIDKLINAKKAILKIHENKLADNLNILPNFEDFVQQNEIHSSQIQDGNFEKQESKTPITRKGNPDILKLQFEKHTAQIKTTRFDANDLKSLTADNKKVISNLSLGNNPDKEISDIVNKIDKNIANLSSQLNTSPAYHTAYIENGVEFNFPIGNNENCLKENTGLSYCELLNKLKNQDPKKPIVNILGIGEYKVVRQKLIKYEAGEIADIRNIFAGEKFFRSIRDLKKTEDITQSETETETEKKDGISTTEKFAISKEISEQVKKTTDKELGVSLTASYGPVSVSANASFATSASTEKSTKSASNYAKETTTTASNSIRNKVIEKRSFTTINELEKINSYKLTNTTDNHKIGIYRWVDKYYENQLYNIGMRAMFEFYIPSPLAFYIFSKQGTNKIGVTIPNPINPKDHLINGKSLTSHKDISRDSYHLWITAYNVKDFSPPAEEFITIQHSFNKELKYNNDEKGTASFSETIQIPKNYVAQKLTFKASATNWYGSDSGWLIIIGGESGWNNIFIPNWGLSPQQLTLPNISESISVSGHGRSATACYAKIDCQISAFGFEEWQIETYTAILESYENMKSDYENAITTAKMESGYQVSGNNPEMNRKIEREELQKWCTEALLLDRFASWNAMKKAVTGEPEIDWNQVKKEAPIVSFINSAFEWENMTYRFLPYFYNNKAEHPKIREISDVDPKFMDALRAGYARVIVPASYGFETAVMHFIETGQIWNGGELPVLDDPLFQSIADEIYGEEYSSIGTPEGDTWETKLPTTLIWLQNDQADGQLPIIL